MAASKSGTIAVLGHYGQRNLGDESITAAAISGVRAIRPDARIIGISLDPEDTHARHGVQSFTLRREVSRTPVEPPAPMTAAAVGADRSAGALRRLARSIPGLVALLRAVLTLPARLLAIASEVWALRAVWRALDDVELVIVAGSNQLLDQFGGAWGFPYTLLKWSMLARLRGARVVLLSVGAGPLDGGLAKLFIRWTLHLAEHASVRDPGSARLVGEIGWAKPVPVKPDLAFGFDVGRPVEHSAATPVGRSGALTVAVNFMPVHDPRYWPDDKPHIREDYLAAMAAFIHSLLAQGHRVQVFGTQPADEWVAEEAIARIPPESRERIALERVRSLDDLARLYRRCDVVAATRFHGILLALRFARPVVAICYYRKSRELMRDFGLERYAIDLAGITAAQLGDAFAALAADRASVERTIRGALAQRCDELAEQYQLVLNLETPDAVRA